jgi:hypothetical protein
LKLNCYAIPITDAGSGYTSYAVSDFLGKCELGDQVIDAFDDKTALPSAM